MTSCADEILFIADTGNKRLVEVRVERADFKLECNVRTVMNLKENVNPTGLCVIEGRLKLLLADSGTFGGLVVLNLQDGTTQQLLRNGSTLCSQIQGVSLNCHSIIFTDTTSHTLKRFSFQASALDNKKEVEKVDTIIGNGTSGAEDGFIDVARVSHPTGITPENGTIFFVDAGSKSVRFITQISAVMKYIRVMEDIYRAFHIHSDILGDAELPSLLKAEQRIEKAEKNLMQILQNAKAKFKVSGTMQGPEGTQSEKGLSQFHK